MIPNSMDPEFKLELFVILESLETNLKSGYSEKSFLAKDKSEFCGACPTPS